MREVILTKYFYGHRARVLHWCTDQIMNEALARMDLTASQGRMMGFISRLSSPPCARDIEEALQLSHPTVSGLLARLEKKGFIEFRPDEQDRRCKRIYILPKGRECDARMHDMIQDIEGRVVRDFTEEEKQQFARFLDRAIQNMGGSPCRRPQKEETNE